MALIRVNSENKVEEDVAKIDLHHVGQLRPLSYSFFEHFAFFCFRANFCLYR